VSDHPETLSTNTTQALIEDLEALGEHLGVERWLVAGASWGSTLALAYAQAHPDRVTEVALFAVTTTSRAEVDWITEHVGRVFPEAWDMFAAAVDRGDGERVVDAYARVLRTGSRAERERAAGAWDAWESTHVSLDPAWQPGPMIADPQRRLVFATLVTHYWSNDAFLGRSGILDRIDRIAHVPAVLLHGRRDISGPAVTAWRLHQCWPASRLTIVEDEGHGGPTIIRQMVEALDGFA
jgi:proline iminopeptidase